MDKNNKTTKGDVDTVGCPSRGVLDLIANKWTVLILHTLSGSAMRHNELARALGDISQKVLTQNLRALERNGFILRTVYPVVPPHVEYALSPLGKKLLGAVETITKWAEGNFRDVVLARERFDKTRG